MSEIKDIKENETDISNQEDSDGLCTQIKERDQYYINLLARSIMILEEVLREESKGRSEAILILDMIIKIHLEFIEEAKLGDYDHLQQFVESHKKLDIVKDLNK